MANTNRIIYIFASLATLLALIVVVLGAYTRLTDAGLGCPDWPGCYGHVTVPSKPAALAQAANDFPKAPIVESRKAWTEMIHRYFAGSLGVLIFVICLLQFYHAKKIRKFPLLPICLIGLLIFQAALGMWTVTLQLLPVVVMGHLLGGLAILALLWLISLQAKNNHKLPVPNHHWQYLRPWALLGLFIIIAQIALGGWTSSNYAALICPNFPFCNGQLFPTMDFKQAFNVFAPIGINYLGGDLNSAARVTIQMVHRYGAFITAIYISILGFWVLLNKFDANLRRIGWLILLVLVLQICLGIFNVLLLLPLPIAVAHNACAAILLLMVTLNYKLQKRTS